MRIAVAQVNPTVGAFEENVASALDILTELASHPAPPDLVVFPAYALTGAPLDGLAFVQAFGFAAAQAVRDFAQEAQLPTLIGSVDPLDVSADACLNAPEVYLCEGGLALPLGFAQTAIFDDADDPVWYDEDGVVITGIDIDISGTLCTVMLDRFVSADDVFSESDVIIRMVAEPYYSLDELPTSESSLAMDFAVAAQSQAWMVCANLVGGQDKTVYPGGSYVFTPYGEVIAGGFVFEETVFVAELTFGAEEIVCGPLAQESFTADELDWSACMIALRDYVHKNGFSDVVVGLSGGIDSSVVATLATDALGSDRVHGVLMPGPYSSAGSVADATTLSENLGIQHMVVPINVPFEAFRETLASVCEGAVSGLALQNLQARIRTIYLMTLSNTHGWMLLNTGNKSEAAMGYSTLYGDTAGAFAPLGNLYKTRVYELARWRNEQKAVIPEETLLKPPSAELSPEQRDDDALPSYDVLDAILTLHIDEEFERGAIVARGFDAHIVDTVLSTISSSEYKRRQEPTAPLFGSMALTEERAWPLTNRFKDRT